MKPHQWNDYDDVTDVLDKVIIILDFIDDNQHRSFIIKQLSEFLSKNDGISDDDLVSVHDKVVLLMTTVHCSQSQQHYQGLQNCQTKLLSMILERSSEIHFEHLISVVAAMPDCDAKNLSLTKLKMILDISEC